MDFRNLKNSKNNLDVDNNVFYKSAKFHLEILYILDCVKITKVKI